MSEKNTHKRVFYSAAYNYFGKVCATCFSALSFILIIRDLNVGEYTHYTFYLNAVFFITLLLDFGQMEVVLRYIPEYIEHKEFSSIRWLLKNTLFMISGSALLLMLAVAVLHPFLGFARTAFNFSSGMICSVILFGCLRISSLVFANILNAFFFQAYRITTEIIISGLRLAVVFVLLKAGADGWVLVGSYALLDLVGSVLFYLRFRKPVSEKTASPVNKNNIRRIFRFGVNEYFYKLFWFFTDNRFDIYLAGIFLGVTQAGYLAFGAGIVNFLMDWSPGFIIRPVISPLFVKEYALRKDEDRIMYFFKLHNKFLVFMTLPVFVFLAVLSDKIIVNVFDPKYLPALPTLLIFITSMFFINIIIPLRNIISLIERPDISNLSNLAAIPKVVLIVLFCASFGIKGIALAYAFSLFLIIFINLFLLKKAIKIEYPWASFLKTGINAGIMGLCAYSVRPFVAGKASLALVLLICAAVYLCASYINKSFSQQDRDIFNRSLKIKLWNF